MSRLSRSTGIANRLGLFHLVIAIRRPVDLLTVLFKPLPVAPELAYPPCGPTENPIVEALDSTDSYLSAFPDMDLPHAKRQCPKGPLLWPWTVPTTK